MQNMKSIKWAFGAKKFITSHLNDLLDEEENIIVRIFGDAHQLFTD